MLKHIPAPTGSAQNILKTAVGPSQCPRRSRELHALPVFPNRGPWHEAASNSKGARKHHCVGRGPNICITVGELHPLAREERVPEQDCSAAESICPVKKK